MTTPTIGSTLAHLWSSTLRGGRGGRLEMCMNIYISIYIHMHKYVYTCIYINIHISLRQYLFRCLPTSWFQMCIYNMYIYNTYTCIEQVTLPRPITTHLIASACLSNASRSSFSIGREVTNFLHTTYSTAALETK